MLFPPFFTGSPEPPEPPPNMFVNMSVKNLVRSLKAGPLTCRRPSVIHPGILLPKSRTARAALSKPPHIALRTFGALEANVLPALEIPSVPQPAGDLAAEVDQLVRASTEPRREPAEQLATKVGPLMTALVERRPEPVAQHAAEVDQLMSAGVQTGCDAAEQLAAEVPHSGDTRHDPTGNLAAEVGDLAPTRG